MRIYLLFLVSLFSVHFTQAQINAVTEKGDEVLLYQDGTWSYLNESANEALEIKTNKKAFKRGKLASFLLKSDRIGIGFWLDPKMWSFSKATSNEEAEYEFQLKEGDLYGMAITEKIEIPLEYLKEIALENGRLAAPDLKIVKEEYRMVNDLKVLQLQMNGTIQGIKFSYYGYYYSSEEGTVQFITYTAQNLLNSYDEEIQGLLNGLVELD